MELCSECGVAPGSYPVVEDGHTLYYCAGCLPSGSFHLILQSPPRYSKARRDRRGRDNAGNPDRDPRGREYGR